LWSDNRAVFYGFSFLTPFKTLWTSARFLSSCWSLLFSFCVVVVILLLWVDFQCNLALIFYPLPTVPFCCQLSITTWNPQCCIVGHISAVIFLKQKWVIRVSELGIDSIEKKSLSSL